MVWVEPELTMVYTYTLQWDVVICMVVLSLCLVLASLTQQPVPVAWLLLLLVEVSLVVSHRSADFTLSLSSLCCKYNCQQSEQHVCPYPSLYVAPLFVRLIQIDDELSLSLVLSRFSLVWTHCTQDSTRYDRELNNMRPDGGLIWRRADDGRTTKHTYIHTYIRWNIEILRHCLCGARSERLGTRLAHPNIIWHVGHPCAAIIIILVTCRTWFGSSLNSRLCMHCYAVVRWCNMYGGVEFVFGFSADLAASLSDWSVLTCSLASLSSRRSPVCRYI